MEPLTNFIQEMMAEEALIEGVISNLRNKSIPYSKVKIKPVLLKDQLHYQFTYYMDPKVLHENLESNIAGDKIIHLLGEDFRQGIFFTKTADIQVLISKKFKVNILQKPPTKGKTNKEIDLSHNRKKRYLLEEGKPISFLVELGVMNKEGRVLAKKYDKFKQINRFLELIDDVVPFLQKERPLNIIDFGCGKSYLTFALYHFLKEIRGFNLKIIGLDLKEDVITHCNQLAEKLEYEQLHFLVGDINQYDKQSDVDMVVTLHACDTATDAALEKAVRWGADVILSVPCCQHELFNQVKSPLLSPMLDHGIIKERFSALATDSIRAQLLEILGYKTQIVEFIDLEHTPKNLLIRATKQTGKKKNSEEDKLISEQIDVQKNGKEQEIRGMIKSYLEFRDFLQVSPYLEKALIDRLGPLFQGIK